MKIKESVIRKMVRKALNESINELDWKTSGKAAGIADNGIPWINISSKLDSLIEEIEMIIENKGREIYTYDDDNFNTQNYYEDKGGLKSLQKWFNTIYKFKEFVDRKESQADNLQNLHNDNFANQHNGVNPNDYEENIGAKMDDWFDKKLNDEVDGDFEDTLNDEELDYWNHTH